MKSRDTKVIIRKATSKDRQRILEYKSLYPFDYFEEYFPSFKCKIKNISLSRRYILFVAELNGEVVGCIGIVKNSFYRNVYYAVDHFVLPKARGMGLGRQLYTRMFDLVADFSKPTARTIKFTNRIESENYKPKSLAESLGFKFFQFYLFYLRQEPNAGFKCDVQIERLDYRTLKGPLMTRLYTIFSETMGSEYFSFFRKTNKLNFLFLDENYREIFIFLLKAILGLNQRVICVIKKNNEVIGYSLSDYNQNRIFLDNQAVDRLSLQNIGLMLHNFLGQKGDSENYYYLPSNTKLDIAKLGKIHRIIESGYITLDLKT